MDAPTLAPPQPKLFSAKAITVGAALGGPLATMILIARNFARLGDRRRRNLSYILGLAIAVSVSWLLINAPAEIVDAIPTAAYSALFAAIAYALVSSIQGKLLEKHFAQGGPKASGWAVAGWSTLSLIAYLAIFASMAPRGAPPYGFEASRYEEGLIDNRIFHDGSVEPETLRALGQFLIESEYFAADTYGAVQIVKSERGHTLSLPCEKSLWNDPETLALFRDFRAQIETALSLKPLGMELVWEDFDGIHRKSLQ